MRFLRIITAAVLLFSVLLVSCGESKEIDVTPVRDAVSEMNGRNSVKGKYQLEITFGGGNVLYFSAGDVMFDRAGEKAFADLEHTYMGASSKLENYFSDGKMISVEDGKAISEKEDPDELFSLFPYCKIPDIGENPEGIKKISNSLGDMYEFSFEDGKKACDIIVGTEIYELAGVLKNPQKDKTEYGQVKCFYTVFGGKLKKCRYEFSVKLFDEIPYRPSYSVPEEEYTIDLDITANLTFDDSSEIKIPEYSGEVTESK